jgi:hypothetical protein
LLSQSRIETSTTPRLVRALRADEHALTARDEPLRVIGGRAADNADGEGLRDVLRDRQELRHRLERLAEIVLVEAGDDHALALIGERRAHRGQLLIEELPLVDPDDFRLPPHARQEFGRFLQALRRNLHLAVRRDVVVAVAIVDGRLENLHLLPGNLRAAHATDQLLALAAEHAAGDDLDPAGSFARGVLHDRVIG